MTGTILGFCSRTVLILFLIAAAVSAQEGSPPPVLDLQKAIDLALEFNRTIRSAGLDVQKSTDLLDAARTSYYPVFNVSVLAGQLLTPLSFTFDEGVFGSYPGIGPIPGDQTKITTPKQLTAYIVGSVQQPLSQLYSVSLNMHLHESMLEEADEKQREKQHEIVNLVKKTYYGIVQGQSALQYAEKEIDLFRELQRVTDDYVVQQVALKADSLQVKAQLAKAEYDALVARNQITTQQEQLNLLLGRDIRTDFQVTAVSSETAFEQDIAAAQNAAINRRPELQQARAKQKQAEYDRRLKKAEYIPDVSISLNYISPVNIDVVPTQIASLGFYFSWDIYDWGKKGSELAAKDRVLEQARLAVEEAESKVLIEVNTLHRKLQESRQMLQIAGLGREAAEEQLRVVANKYAEKAALLKEVLQAQSSLEESKDQYQNALLSFWSAKADFEKAVGDDYEK